MRRSPLTLALAVVTGCLAAVSGGYTAFADHGRDVRLDVDGRVRTVHTGAHDVAGVLAAAGVTLGPHDTVSPARVAPVRAGTLIVVRHGRLLRLTVDGTARAVWVTALTVRDALGELGLAAPGAWMSVPGTRAVPRAGLTLALRLPQHVVVLVGGHRLARRTTAPTVRVLLRALHVPVHPLDHVSVPLDRYPRSGLVVRVDRISQNLVRSSVPIPFRTRQVRTSTLYVGQSKVVRYGVPGVRVRTYRLTWRNHRLVRRHLVGSRVRSHPRAQVVAVGTRQRPRYTPASDGLNWSALARCESGGNPTAVSADGRYRGLYQFTLATWHSLGGSGDPIAASSSEQTYRAQLLYRRSGAGAWPRCGQYLYT